MDGDLKWYDGDGELDNIMREAELEDLRSTGAFFTWQIKRENTILRKLDRAMVNAKWLVDFPASEACFLPLVTSNHTPCLIIISRDQDRRRVPFKFFELWTMHADYDRLVREAWSIPVLGYPMFVLYRKLGALKVKLKRLNRNTLSDLSFRVIDVRANLVSIHETLLDRDSRGDLGVMEKDASRKFNMLALMDESLMRQKARVCWLELGDRNTTFFFRTLKRRHNRNIISSLTRDDGVVLSDRWK